MLLIVPHACLGTLPTLVDHAKDASHSAKPAQPVTEGHLLYAQHAIMVTTSAQIRLAVPPALLGAPFVPVEQLVPHATMGTT